MYIDPLNFAMVVFLLAIIFLAVALCFIELGRVIWRSMFSSSRSEVDEVDESDIDPYDVGINDKHIL